VSAQYNITPGFKNLFFPKAQPSGFYWDFAGFFYVYSDC